MINDLQGYIGGNQGATGGYQGATGGYQGATGGSQDIYTGGYQGATGGSQGSQGGAIGGSQGGARKKMFKSNHCSPGKNDVEGSCLDDDIVIKVAKALNKLCKKNNKKKLNEIDLSRSPEDIHGDVCEEIAKISKCSSEACWQKIKSLMDELGSDKEEFKDSFKPQMPKKWVKDYNEWLSTFEIEDCLEQHMEADDNFYFYGAVPIDFKKCSVSNLCSFDMKKHLDKGQSKIGIVFNTDPSTKDGQHWISLYMDLGKHNSDNHAIYYFDSFGRKPPKQIKELIDKAKKQGSKLDCEPQYFYNDHSYQRANAQCGMYAIHFIKKMLEGLSFEAYLREPLSDKLMRDLRSDYFIKL
jgi:hypothetical protein